MPFLSQLIGKTVRDDRDRPVGKLRDLVVPSGALYPSIKALVVSRPRGQAAIIPWEQVGTLEPRQVRLLCALEELTSAAVLDTDLQLRRDVLDKQIVDTEGVKVVRVNDLLLTRVNGGYRLTGVDNSVGGLLRRLGLGAFPFVRALPGERALIKWEDIDLVSSTTPYAKLKGAHQNLARLHPADIAEIVSQFNTADGIAAIEALEDETAARAMAEMEEERQAIILEQMDSERAADILEEMAPDDAADVLAEIPKEKSAELIRLMEPEAAEDVKELLTYPKDSAGGLMSTDFVATPSSSTAEEIINTMRQLAPDAETAYYIYVTDDEERLLGVISLRDLVIAQPWKRAAEFLHPEAVSVNVNDEQDEVVEVLTKYNLLAVPVVDDEDRIHGIVTAHDVIDVALPRAWHPKSTKMAD
ncbi:MAG: magnesium transporter [Chloroflexi bacterium]|nr:magnesium transporter [Chloroflexota bacterium]